jgi:hypothetical protein
LITPSKGTPVQEEIPMYRTQENTQGNGEHPRLNTLKRALLWLTAVLVAVFPFPWWW